MKKFILFALLTLPLNILLPWALSAQNPESYPNYVVIGAFAHHKNAVQFTDDANKHDFSARFEMNPNRNLYYVYVLSTPDREVAFARALTLRNDTKYFDTWVYCGLLGETVLASPGGPVQDFNPVTRQAMQTVTVNPTESKQQHIAQDREGGLQTASGLSAGQQLPSNDNGPLAARTTTQDENAVPVDNGTTLNAQTLPGETAPKKVARQEDFPRRVSSGPLSSEEVAGKNFFFQLFRADNRAWVEGEVDAIDVEKSRKMASYAANTSVKVVLPSGKSKQVSFVCQVFGYRKQQKEFDPAKPSEEFFLDEKGNLVVPFELVRLQKGDIAIMYNVFFFKDAAVMRPESRYEVNNLLDLLQENPSYKIRIHGHTNGNASGKIIRMDKPESFYTLAGTKEGYGSAKKLSEERALVMRQYLVNSGIPEERMQIKAWGGKKPIHDKHSVRANENVRVEIEILDK